MLKAINTFFENKSSVYITCICLFVICALGIIDHLTGYEISFSIFYIFPITIGAWYADRRSGYILCYFSAVVWYVVDYSSGHRFSNPLIPYWNAFVRAGFFVIISYLVSLVKYNYEIEKELARTDSLTGVMNLRVFSEISEALFKVAGRSKCSISICYIDVDNFKYLNDTFGHDEGDRVLIAVATTLKLAVRKSDLVGRLGGDEFAVLLYDTDLSGAKTFTNRILDRLHIGTSDTKSKIGFSIGVAIFSTSPSSTQEAIKFADTLMYRAKRLGGNQIVYGDLKKSDDVQAAPTL